MLKANKSFRLKENRGTKPNSNEDPAQRLARADLCRFLAACYYEPCVEFVEERLFDSMCAAAERLDPDLAQRARRLADAFHRQTLDDLLVDYTRLFLGPGPVATQPYGRVWMDGEKPVLPMYAEAGFEIDESSATCPITSRRSSNFSTCCSPAAARPR
jgi:TorA maturation chaperone TorD